MIKSNANQNCKSLELLKDIHVGERLFVLGTGPSLLETNLDLLKDEILFGVNRLFLGYEDFNIKCQYYGVSDPKIPYLQDVLKLNTQLFLGHGACDRYLAQYFSRKIQVKNYPSLLPLLGWMWQNENNFSHDITKGTYNGWTVICDIPLQVALYMGFSEVYLLGCDWDFTESSHFYDNKKNTNDPAFHQHSELSYKACKKHYIERGSKIFNATPNSKLEVFEKIDLEKLF